MKLIVISGLSGSGKTVALHTLEDEEFYCVDNLPPSLLPTFVREISDHGEILYTQTAIGIDARTNTTDFGQFPTHLKELRDSNVDTQLIFLDADTEVLIKRFSETRRRHPLSHSGLPLIDAIEQERLLLSSVKEHADLVIDTSSLTVHSLREFMLSRVRSTDKPFALSILFQSFAFKHGIPGDSDFVFDVRCLPNPYWVPELRPLTGRDTAVQNFLKQQTLATEMLKSIVEVLEKWLPHYEAEKRRYITVSIGCNGGQHRSVYLCECLRDHFKEFYDGVTMRHRELQS